jgi:hypothetical protein
VVHLCAVKLNIQQSHVLPTQLYLCFVWIWEQTAIISLYSINRLVFITERKCVYCAVRTEHWTFTNPTFCPHSCIYVLCGSQNKQRIFHYTILTDWFFNWDGKCSLRGTDWVFRLIFLCKGFSYFSVQSHVSSLANILHRKRRYMH